MSTKKTPKTASVPPKAKNSEPHESTVRQHHARCCQCNKPLPRGSRCIRMPRYPATRTKGNTSLLHVKCYPGSLAETQWNGDAAWAAGAPARKAALDAACEKEPSHRDPRTNSFPGADKPFRLGDLGLNPPASPRIVSFKDPAGEVTCLDANKITILRPWFLGGEGYGTNICVGGDSLYVRLPMDKVLKILGWKPESPIDT